MKNIEYKTPDVTNLATNAFLNVKTNEVKGEIPSINNLAMTAAINAKINEVKGEIPHLISSLLVLLLLLKMKYLMLVI